jgi:hypothetical protein
MTLAEYRLSLGYTKRAMAERLGVHVTTWCKWELFNDPKGRRACGLPVDMEDLRCRSVNVSLSPAAHARWAAMPAGQRSKWVSKIIEEQP